MTEGERREVRECVRLLVKEDAFDEAVGRLCRLVGMCYPAWERTKNVRRATLPELTRGGDRPFRVDTCED